MMNLKKHEYKKLKWKMYRWCGILNRNFVKHCVEN
jgi:hypothetical protein